MKSLGIKPLSIAVLLSTGLLSGCFFEGEQSLEKMDTPPDKAAVSNSDMDSTTVQTDKEKTDGEETSKGTVSRDIYLLDSNGLVVPQTLELPASKEVALQSLQYMVKDGPVTELLPEGFQAVLPAGTEIKGINLKDGTLTVDVSKEFGEYAPKDEKKILQALTYTLTQFDNVERLKLWIDGKEQNTMPVNGSPITEGVSRSDGINIQVGDQTDLVNSEAVTVYFPSQNDQQIYDVPVTTRVKKADDTYETVVQALLDGPELGTALQQPFNEEAELLSTDLKDGVLTLTFNEGILSGEKPKAIADEALSSLVLSLTEMKEVEAVQIKVEGADEVFNESGQPLTEPVTRADITAAKSL
ncbi:GerMN domain-containing protein [Halobacillus rhizosphaerae]|uniref:GerMN domain-containing protein n=1 Tax=Halobacillus rhizosphaerae TaxID=3064889 RepID=UPI00398B213D